MIAATASRVSPWSRGTRGLLVVSLTLAALAIVTSWFFAAGRNDPDDQFVFVSVSLAGIACEVSGVSRWVKEGRRSVRSYRRELLGGVSRAARSVAPAAVASSADLVARPEGRWIHRADCPFVAGRRWESPATQEGRRPCPACRP